MFDDTGQDKMQTMSVFDPRSAPVLRVDDDLPAIPAAALTAAALHQRFAEASRPWTPEKTFEPSLNRPLRQAAVLVPILDGDHGRLSVLLTRRTMQLRDHAGQISFPGGRAEPEDENAVATALREAHEEVGLAGGAVEVLGQLPRLRTISAYDVTPVVGWLAQRQPLRLQAVEVEEAFEVPLAFLMNPANHRWHERVLGPDEPGAGMRRRWISMEFQRDNQRYLIWGATAAILRNLYRYLRA